MDPRSFSGKRKGALKKYSESPCGYVTYGMSLEGKV